MIEFAPSPSHPHLYATGPLDALDAPMRVAIVGARAATNYGAQVAHQIVEDLPDDAVILSGGAYGIDGAAHRAALSTGHRTVAVLASQKLYPAGHLELFERIDDTDGCALVTTEGPDPYPTRARFLARNEVLVSLATHVIVVEAGFRSGTLNTAGHATRLGVPLFAVPGPITSAAAAGSNELIRSGRAALFSGVGDLTTMEEA